MFKYKSDYLYAPTGLQKDMMYCKALYLIFGLIRIHWHSGGFLPKHRLRSIYIYEWKLPFNFYDI